MKLDVVVSIRLKLDKWNSNAGTKHQRYRILEPRIDYDAFLASAGKRPRFGKKGGSHK